MRFIWESRPIDGMILYEAFDFIAMDPATGEARVAEEMQSMLDTIRRRGIE